MQAIYSFFVGLVNKLVDALILILPVSPFQKFINSVDSIPYLGILNYFVPLSTMLSIFLAWITALALYYMYGIIMRWVKIVGE